MENDGLLKSASYYTSVTITIRRAFVSEGKGMFVVHARISQFYTMEKWKTDGKHIRKTYPKSKDHE